MLSDIWNNIVNFYHTDTGFIIIIVSGVTVSICCMIPCIKRIMCC